MENELQLLLCEDLEADAEMVIRVLERAGYTVLYRRVETAEDMRAALMEKEWDIVISDYSIPGFGGPQAMNVLKESGIEIPFVLVSGTIGEEIAVNMMKAGANDYLMKHNLIRLSEVVKRELIEAAYMKERKAVAELIKANEEKYHAVINNSLLAILLARPGGKIMESNKAASALFGYSEKEFREMQRDQLFEISDASFMQRLNRKKEVGSASGECIAIRKNGERFYCEMSTMVFKDIKGEDLSCYMIADISARKNAEQRLIDTNKELKKLSNHLKDAREDERKYISREIHDQLGQLASALKIEIDWLNINLPDPGEKVKSRIDHALSIIRAMIKTTRKIATALRPSIIDELGLVESLQWQCAEFKKLNGIECDFTQDIDDRDMSIEMRTELFRICQESLTNVMRHANAKTVEVRVQEKGDWIEMMITDDGNGFDTNQKSSHLGLVGLRERALSINGELYILSQPGLGTTIRVVVQKNKTGL